MTKKLFEPRAGGWTRLNAKLAAHDLEQSRELVFLRGLAVAMVALVVIVAVRPLSSAPALEEKIEKTPIMSVPGMPATIHYYWVN